MRKNNQFLAVGSLLIILLGIVLVGVWLRFNAGQGSLNALQPTATSLTTCRGNWQQMPMDVSKNVPTRLQGVAAISANDMWAVGDGPIEHWNGTNWQAAQTPSVQHGTWTAITALAVNDIWVIGQSNGEPQALHWDGKTWIVTLMPTLAPSIATLAGITAITPDNAWVVGTSRTGDLSQPLMLHWNGTQWREVAGATLPSGSNPRFGSISAVSANDIWIVGNFVDAPKGTRELTEHWNGTNWQFVPPPDQGNIAYTISSATLNSVTAVSANDVWAAGSWNLSGHSADGSASGMIEHWDGQKWNRVQISGPESRSDGLNAIKAFSPTNIWAVGSFENPNTRLGEAYMEHWDGKQWGLSIWPVFYGQAAENSSFGLSDVSSTPDGQIIAVGSSIVFTQNPPIDDATRNPSQPFILASCH